MLSTVLEHPFFFAILALSSSPVLAADAQAVLSCETQEAERGALKQASEAARRVSEHVLIVTTKRGPQRFIDKPPHDEGVMNGQHWRYCGFDPLARAHLIQRYDQGLNSGKLLLQDTGKLLHAGHTVFFAPSLKQFLAIEQEPGQDGENWAVREMTGKTLWKGYAGTVANVEGVDMVVSTFAEPKWTKRGELTALFQCAGSQSRGVVTLVKLRSGDWGWSGDMTCP